VERRGIKYEYECRSLHVYGYLKNWW